MNQALGTALTFGLTHSVHLMPPMLRRKLAQRMAYQQATYDREFSSTVISNLARALPHYGRDKVLSLGIENAGRTSRAQLDFLWAWRASATAISRKVHIEGADVVARSGKPAIVVGCHQLGFELAALRLSIEHKGGIVVDSGDQKVARSAYRAWSRFNNQQIIEIDGALRGCRDVLSRNEKVLLLVDEPPLTGKRMPSRAVGNVEIRISPLVPILRARAAHPVFWFDIGVADTNDQYILRLQPLIEEGEVCDADQWADRVAERVRAQWRSDPVGYWWARCLLRDRENSGPASLRKVQ